MKSKLKLENILCMFIIICPILDAMSFLYRNILNTSVSPSTIIRPLIPIAVILYLFIKKDKKFKFYSLGIAGIYGIYAIIHLYLFSLNKTRISYSNELHELQYLINYTFMVLNLFIYTHTFSKIDTEKLVKSIIISNVIYMLIMYVSILTGTSSSTYIEGMGFKGWFESGNSISAILLLSMFIYLPYIKNKKNQKIIIPILTLVGIYLTMLIGTRAGLYGFILITALYVLIEIIYGLIKNGRLNKKIVIGGSLGICIILLVVVGMGSTTMKRRQYLQSIESNIIDEAKQENSHITGSLLEIKEKIENDTLEENYMSETQKKSIMDLYNIANKFEVKNNDQRTQQFIYNLVLVKNQKSLPLIMFGNGYLTNFRELVFEMEVPAILINFGLIGFILYLGPFVSILFIAVYKGIKNRKNIDSEYVFLVFGSLFTFALSFFSGYTFFNSSTMIIIIVLNTILFTKMKNLDKEDNKKLHENEKSKQMEGEQYGKAFIWDNRANNSEEQKEYL